MSSCSPRCRNPKTVRWCLPLENFLSYTCTRFRQLFTQVGVGNRKNLRQSEKVSSPFKYGPVCQPLLCRARVRVEWGSPKRGRERHPCGRCHKRTDGGLCYGGASRTSTFGDGRSFGSFWRRNLNQGHFPPRVGVTRPSTFVLGFESSLKEDSGTIESISKVEPKGRKITLIIRREEMFIQNS